MKDAIGNTFMTNFIIIFTVIFIGLFVGSITYTKSIRIKNRIINIIEENGGYDKAMSEEDGEITKFLHEAGYRISPGSSDCKLYGKDVNGTTEIVKYGNEKTSQYRYCIYEYTTNKGSYYGVKVFMYIDLPIIGDLVEVPVYGETKMNSSF